MPCKVSILATVLVILCSFCVTGILHNGTGIRKSKPMSMPVLKIKIVENNKSPPKVSAKIIGKGNPIPKIMARIYHGPKAKQMFRRKYFTQPISQQPLYYRKFPQVKNLNPLVSNFANPSTQVASGVHRINQPHFRGPPSYPVKLHFTSPNELESNHLSDNSIMQPTSPKGYLPLNNPQADYLKLLGDISNNEHEFLEGHQSNFPKPSQYSPHPIPVHNLNEESIQLQFYPQNIAPDKIQPNLSEEAKRYIEFMASGDYFLPKAYPDYRKIPSAQNYYASQPKYVERQSQRYIPLNQDTPEISRSRNPEKIEFTEEDAIHSQYNGAPLKDSEIDIRGRFVGNSIFGRKKEYDTRGSESFLSEGVVKEPQQNFKRIPESDDTGHDGVNNKIIKAPSYSVTEFCDKKCSDNDYGDNIDLLCGTDRVTYYSEAQLLCIVSCTNSDIDIDYRGPCIQGRE